MPARSKLFAGARTGPRLRVAMRSPAARSGPGAECNALLSHQGGGMDLQLTNRVVVVTGGAKGIGAAIVRGCAAEGALPVIVDRDCEASAQLQEELRASGTEARVIFADLSEAKDCEEAIRQAAASAPIGALVNNAGVNDRVGLEHGSPDQYIVSLRKNLLHYYNMAHFALPWLKKTHGPIVNIASKTALTGQGGTSGYASSKGAILALTAH